MAQKKLEQLGQLFFSIWLKAQLPIGSGPRHANRLPVFTVHIPAKFEIVGQEQIAKRAQVAFHLVGFLDLAEALAHVLGFDITERHLTPGDDEIRGAALDVPGLVGGGHALAHGFHEGF